MYWIQPMWLQTIKKVIIKSTEFSWLVGLTIVRTPGNLENCALSSFGTCNVLFLFILMLCLTLLLYISKVVLKSLLNGHKSFICPKTEIISRNKKKSCNFVNIVGIDFVIVFA